MIAVDFTFCLAFLWPVFININADKLIEFRIPMPLDVNAYEIALLNTVAEESLLQTGGGEGVEVRVNEIGEITTTWPFPNQYTDKIWHMRRRIPPFIRWLLPLKMHEIYEKSRNSYPRTMTRYTNPDYMKWYFYINVTSLYLPGDCKSENALELSQSQLSNRIVETLDIVNTPMSKLDYDPKYDPKLCMSSKTGQGKLKSDWQSTSQPIMCAYKVFEIRFAWWGLQKKAEDVIQRSARRILNIFNRYLYCTQDTWVGMTMEEMRAKEAVVKDELDKLREDTESIRGINVY